MKTSFKTALLLATVSVSLFAAQNVAVAPNGIEMPKDYKSWRVIAPSHRIDHHSVRVILGNDVAMQAIENKMTNPWPKGTVLAKVVWKERHSPEWPSAIVPGEFIHAEFMFKDEKKYAKTQGWGYARWVGDTYQPYGKDASFVNECASCHAPVKSNDYVYTIPARLP